MRQKVDNRQNDTIDNLVTSMQSNMMKSSLSGQLTKMKDGDTNLNSPSHKSINKDTNLLDVLAKELQQKGLNPSEIDDNGFACITGLETRHAQSMSSRAGQTDRSKKKNEFSSTLSAVKTIKIQPGVTLKEFKAENRRSSK